MISGYQIITIDISKLGLSLGTQKTLSYNDVKGTGLDVFIDNCSSGEHKPYLIDIKGEDIRYIGFGVFHDTTINLAYLDNPLGYISVNVNAKTVTVAYYD